MPSFSAQESGTLYPESPVTIGISPEITDPIDNLVPQELVRQAKSVGIGATVLDSRFLPGLSEHTSISQFNEISEHGLTREECGHELLFGQLLIRAADDAEQSVHVAVKPFNTPQAAAHEYAVASRLSSGAEAGLTTFTPLGIYRLPDTKQWGLITKYDHSVRSLDTILWNPNLITDEQKVSKALARSAISAVNLWERGWTHGDLQAKNVAWDITQPLGRTVIIDVEEAQKISDTPSELEAASAKERIRADMRAFFGSLYYLQQVPAGYEEHIEQHFCLPVQYAIEAADSRSNAGLIPDLDETVQLLHEERKHNEFQS